MSKNSKSGKYKNRTIEVKEEKKGNWNVVIDGISYDDLSADNSESAYENGIITIEIEMYYKKHPQR